MLKEVEIFASLILLLFSIFIIFNARAIVRSKMDKSNENIKVNIIKGLGVIITIFALVAIYYLK